MQDLMKEETNQVRVFVLVVERNFFHGEEYLKKSIFSQKVPNTLIWKQL